MSELEIKDGGLPRAGENETTSLEIKYNALAMTPSQKYHAKLIVFTPDAKPVVLRPVIARNDRKLFKKIDNYNLSDEAIHLF